jgi:SAM-dependent methyltransferase
MSQTQEQLVTRQFGPRAADYLTSAVHAAGEDLQQLAASVAGAGTARLLDLGCGAGHVAFAVAPAVAEVVAYDLSADMLAVVAESAAKRGLRNLVTRQGGAESLPFADASFDVVMSRFSAHHWRSFAAGLAEARRVLRPAGRAVFVDAVAPEAAVADSFLQAIELLRDPSHVRDYSPAEWRRTLIGAGFSPGATTARRLRLDFASWVARMRTPPLHVEAIRSLQQKMAAEVTGHFAIEADGSFTIDCMTVEATPA